jgi:hypothetical protein
MSRNGRKRKLGSLRDTIVLYHSRTDRCWVAHGLHTDQIGTGQSIVDALTDAIRAIHQVAELAAADHSIAYRREAPAHVQRKARQAKKLPKEIYEIAYKRVHGDWPSDLAVDVRPAQTRELFAAAFAGKVGA